MFVRKDVYLIRIKTIVTEYEKNQYYLTSILQLILFEVTFITNSLLVVKVFNLLIFSIKNTFKCTNL